MEVSMAEKRITVWVQRFNDRPYPMLQWIDPETGRRKSKSAGTVDEKAVEDARADLEYELTHGKYLEASRMAWERFRELFEEEYLPNLRPGTRKAYRRVLDLFEELCHPGKVRSINERTVSRFVTGLREIRCRGRVGMQQNTIHVKLQYLHGTLRWAADQKMIPAVPKFPTIKVPKKKPQPVPAESFERLLDKAPDAQLRAYLLCGWLAGLRLAEAFNLAWEPNDEAPYLDLERNRIILPAGMVKAVEDQWVPLDPVLRQVLEALPRQEKQVFTFTDGRGGKMSGQPVTVDAISFRIVKLARKAGVKLTMRSLRRGFGCRYAGKVSAHVLQRLMRHSDIKTTLAYYANFDAAVEEAVLGPQRNTLRNTTEPAVSAEEKAVDVSPCQNGSNSNPGGLGCPNQCDRS
jgi:integrase